MAKRHKLPCLFPLPIAQRPVRILNKESPIASTDIGWSFDNSYARLPEILFAKVKPAPVRRPSIAIVNYRLADELGLRLRDLSDEAAAGLFTGQRLPAGAEPIAQAYAGHQYGGFTMLGDGRAILMGEHRTPSGLLVDIQFKGSGQTPFSRRGDGRAAFGPMLREYLISEAMHALGIPTTRSLAVAGTGEPVFREETLRGAVLTRVAASHIRVGTFQYLAALEDHANLRILADYTIARHYPELIDHDTKYLAFLEAVMRRQAELIARWQLIGFIHGVMNTDNMAVSGETIDYGPCAFMDTYHPETVFSSIDQYGRYAYSNQPKIAQWNLARFAETLLPLIDPDQAKAIAVATELLKAFPAMFEGFWLSGMRRKLGLLTEESDDLALIQSLLDWMQTNQADFTNTFRDLSFAELPTEAAYRDPTFTAWHARWQARLAGNHRPVSDAYAVMQSTNPAVIPRNHRVEEALAAAHDEDDFSLFQRFLTALESPFNTTPDKSDYRTPPPPNQCGYQTFCGT